VKREKSVVLIYILVLLLVIGIAIPFALQVFSTVEPWVVSEHTRIIWAEGKDSSNSDDSLRAQVRLFDAELASKLNRSALPIVYGSKDIAREGDIILVLDSSLAIAQQGYVITLSNGMVTISSSDRDGLFYGCRELIQQMLVNGSVSAVSDAPDVLERAVSLDNGRKYFSVDEIKELIREMSWSKMNALALHFSEEMGLGIESKLYPWLAGRDGTLCVAKEIETDNRYLTQAEIKEIVEYANLYHVEIIPSFDSPGHMNYIVKKFNEKCKSASYSFKYNSKTYTAAAGSEIGNYLHYNNQTAIVQGSRNKSYSRGIDISNDVAVAFTQSLVQEYATLFGELGCTKFDIGGDELLGWGDNTIVSTSTVSRWQQLDHWKTYAKTRTGNSKAVAYDAFLLYMNDMNALVRRLGYTSVRMWNDDALRSSDTGWTGVVTLDKSIDIWYWTSEANGSKNTVNTYLDSDYEVYNILSDYNYYVLNDDYFDDRSDGFAKAVAMTIYDEWNPFVFDPSSTNLGSGNNSSALNRDVLGSAFGIWCDCPSLRTGKQVIEESLPLIRAHAAKAWQYDCNSNVSYTQYTSKLQTIGSAPADYSQLPSAPECMLDLDCLDVAVSQYNQCVSADYTAESYAVYARAVADAQSLAKDLLTTQSELDAAVTAIEIARSNLYPVGDVVDKQVIVSAATRSETVLRGQTVTISFITTEKISAVYIYDDLGYFVQPKLYFADASTDCNQIIAVQFVEKHAGQRTYRISVFDVDGKLTSDEVTCSIVCY
jgi:N-acetyl-beta-hexosaminidase